MLKASRPKACVSGALAATLLIGAALLPPAPARACIPVPDATGLTEMSSRRAVIWLKSQQAFEMIFQNQYSGDSKSFAWIIPLPGVPTLVDQPSDSFLDDLDRITAPMIENRSCVIPCDRGWGADAGVAPPANAPSGPQVTIWGSGKLGDLEYVTLSSSNSQDLMDWLADHGFNLDLSLQAIVDTYLVKDFVFFAAKIAADVTSVAAVPTVRFTFDRTTTPVVYPVRISAFNRANTLGTTIWLISDEGPYLPANYPTAAVEGTEHTEESYKQALELLQASNGGRTLVVQYSGQLFGDYDRQTLFYSSGFAAAELSQLFDSSKNLHVVRLSGELEPLGMDADLELKLAASAASVTGWFQTPCPDGVVQEPCDDGGLSPDPTDPDPTVLPSAPDSESDPSALPGTGDDAGGCRMVGDAAGLSLATILLLLGLVAVTSRLRRHFPR